MLLTNLERIAGEEREIRRPSIKKESNYHFFENLVSEKLDSKVRISKNKMEIYFANREELEKLLEKMGIKIEDE